MTAMDLFSNPLFWAIAISLASFLVVLYFILTNAIANGIRQAHEQERLDEEERKRGVRR